MRLKKGSDSSHQLFVKLYTLSIYSSLHKQLIRSFRTLSEAHIVSKYRMLAFEEEKIVIVYCVFRSADYVIFFACFVAMTKDKSNMNTSRD